MLFIGHIERFQLRNVLPRKGTSTNIAIAAVLEIKLRNVLPRKGTRTLGRGDVDLDVER